MRREPAPLQIVTPENEAAIRAAHAVHCGSQPAQPARENFESYRQALRDGLPAAYAGYGNTNTFPETETRLQRLGRMWTEFRLARREVRDATAQQLSEMGLSVWSGAVRHRPYIDASCDQESDYQTGR